MIHCTIDLTVTSKII